MSKVNKLNISLNTHAYLKYQYTGLIEFKIYLELKTINWHFRTCFGSFSPKKQKPKRAKNKSKKKKKSLWKESLFPNDAWNSERHGQLDGCVDTRVSKIKGEHKKGLNSLKRVVLYLIGANLFVTQDFERKWMKRSLSSNKN